MSIRLLPFLGISFCIACGTSNKSPDNKGENRANDSSTSLNYWDIRNAHAERISVSKFPSQLHEGSLVDACKSGQIFEFDSCWDSIIIDADNLSVQLFSDNGLPSPLIQIDKQIPTEFINSIPQENSYAGNDEFTLFQHHHLGVNPVVHETCYADTSNNTILLQPGSAWGWLIPVLANGNNAPWASSKCFAAKAGILKSISFKSTFIYGFTNNGETKTQIGESFSLAHNWDYKGSIRINGNNYTLPVTLNTIEPEVSKLKGQDGIFFVEHKTEAGVARLVSIPSIIEARKNYTQNSLTHDKLITEIIFGATIASEVSHDSSGDSGNETH